MFEFIKEDYHHACLIESSNCKAGLFHKIKTFMRVLFRCYGLQVVITYRFCRWTFTYRGFWKVVVRYLLRPFALALHSFLGFIYDIHISPIALISPGFYIGHFGGIRIGCCKIGRWCNVNQQVIIKDYKGDMTNIQTVIGNYVWIGAHSNVEAGVTINNRATISVGTHVTKNISSGVLVAGSSCRVIMNNYNNSDLLGLPEH